MGSTNNKCICLTLVSEKIKRMDFEYPREVVVESVWAHMHSCDRWAPQIHVLAVQPWAVCFISLSQWSPSFWHQGLVSWKTVFPWTGGYGGWEGWCVDGFGMIQVHYI